MKTQASSIRALLLCSAAFSVMSASVAYAQQAPVAPAPEPAKTEEAKKEERKVETVVVTGSRIRRTEFSATQPIQVITANAATLEGLNTAAEAIQGSSTAAGSTQINQLFRGFLVDGGVGAQTVSLRGLGSTRTLVLLNGRRAGVSGQGGRTGPFDAGVLPDAAIDRYEILKDGASSVYGSDAVAGVLNVITSRGFDDLEVAVSGNVPFEDGGTGFDVNARWGNVFDRGEILVVGQYQRQDKLAIKDREYTNCNEDYLFDLNGARLDRIDSRTGRPFCLNQLNNVVQIFTNAARTVNPGTISPVIPGTTDALNPSVPIVGLPGFENWSIVPAVQSFRQVQDSAQYQNSSVIPEADTVKLYATGSYDLQILNNAELYGEFLYNRRDLLSEGTRQLFPFVSATSPLVPAQFRRTPFGNIGASFTPVGGGTPVTGAIPNPNPAVTLAATAVRPIITIPSTDETTLDYFNFVGGIRGEISGLGFLNGWSWDAYAVVSRSRTEYSDDAIPQDRVDALTQMVLDGSGNLVCPATTFVQAATGFGGATGRTVTTPAGCPSGINIVADPNILAGNLPSNLRNWLLQRQTGVTTYERELFNASMTGDLFKVPAGIVSAAVGIEHRTDRLDDLPGEFSRTYNVWGRTTALQTKGEDSVTEVFAEVQAPIVASVPLVESLNFNGSYRWFDYKSYGSDSVYKVGLDWRLTSDFRVRANVGTAYRTPQLFELFLGNQLGFVSAANDPCITNGLRANNPRIAANCRTAGVPDSYAGQAASIPSRSQGGAGSLTEERSKSTVYSFIWTPTFLPDRSVLNVSADYFDIEIDDQIAGAGAAAVLFQCYNTPSDQFNVNTGFCGLFQRDPASFAITNVNNQFRNLNKQVTRGLDLTIEFRQGTNFGDFRFFSQNTFTYEDQIDLFDGLINEFNGETGDPELAGNLQLSFERKDWTFTWSSRYISKTSDLVDLPGLNPDVGFARYQNLVGFVPAFDAFGQGIQIRPDNTVYKATNEFLMTHSFSVRYEADKWDATVGVSNLFGEEPPAQSAGIGALRIGRSQFAAIPPDLFIGRQLFFGVSRRF